MRKPPPDRLLTLGSTLATVGMTLAVAYWVYGLQASPPVSFWHLPGYLGIGLVLLGLVSLVLGLFGRSSPGTNEQTQRGGSHSINIQSARDVFVGKDGDE
jgi:hypothetical protein